MPRKIDCGTWEGAPHYRWVKMHKGIRYRVTCSELGRGITSNDSFLAARGFWNR